MKFNQQGCTKKIYKTETQLEWSWRRNRVGGHLPKSGKLLDIPSPNFTKITVEGFFFFFSTNPNGTNTLRDSSKNLRTGKLL